MDCIPSKNLVKQIHGMKLKGARGKHMFFACGVSFLVLVAAKQPLLQHQTQSSHSEKQGSRKNYNLEHFKRVFFFLLWYAVDDLR